MELLESAKDPAPLSEKLFRDMFLNRKIFFYENKAKRPFFL